MERAGLFTTLPTRRHIPENHDFIIHPPPSLSTIPTNHKTAVVKSSNQIRGDNIINVLGNDPFAQNAQRYQLYQLCCTV
jgi:hypothetical protein